MPKVSADDVIRMLKEPIDQPVGQPMDRPASSPGARGVQGRVISAPEHAQRSHILTELLDHRLRVLLTTHQDYLQKELRGWPCDHGPVHTLLHFCALGAGSREGRLVYDYLLDIYSILQQVCAVDAARVTYIDYGEITYD
jgi:hypothetical protein